MPPAQQANEIAVDAGDDQSHGAGGTESLNGDSGGVVTLASGGLLQE